jgi:hypothetical protein
VGRRISVAASSCGHLSEQRVKLKGRTRGLRALYVKPRAKEIKVKANEVRVCELSVCELCVCVCVCGVCDVCV